jgi:hypothetical protein
MPVEPTALGFQGRRAQDERPKLRAARRRKVCPPPPVFVRLDGADAADDQLAQLGQAEQLAVHARDRAVGRDDQLHLIQIAHEDSSFTSERLLVGRRIRRRG